MHISWTNSPSPVGKITPVGAQFIGIVFAVVQSLRVYGLRLTIDFWGKEHGTRTITTMARQRKQRLAAGGGDVRRIAKHSRTNGSLWRHRQEEMGDQLRLHGNLRIRLRLGRLGSVRLQHGVRTAVVSIPRHAGPGDIGYLHHRASYHSGGGV